MTCKRVLGLVDEIAEGKADPSVEREAREHAAVCEACAASLERAVAFRKLLDSSREELRAPATLLDAVRESIEAAPARLNPIAALRAMLTSPVAKGAALAAMACAMVWLVARPVTQTTSGLPIATASMVRQSGNELTEDVDLGEVLASAAALNEEAPLFSDDMVIEVARAQATGAATECLGL